MFLARKAVGELVDHDVREQRGRPQRAPERLGGQRRRGDLGRLRALARDAVLRPRDDEADVAATLPPELAAFLEAAPLRLAPRHHRLEDRIREVDPLLRQRGLP